MKIYLINLFCFILLGSSIGYAVQRYNHRFFAFKYTLRKITGKDTRDLIPLSDVSKVTLKTDRIKGLAVPSWQAEDFEQTINFLHMNSSPHQPILIFHELAIYHFILDRPFIGRFPMVTYTWMNDRWHQEFMADLKENKPPLVILDKNPGDWFQTVYFKVKKNKDKYDELLDYIHNHYSFIKQTPSLLIYQLNE